MTAFVTPTVPLPSRGRAQTASNYVMSSSCGQESRASPVNISLYTRRSVLQAIAWASCSALIQPGKADTGSSMTSSGLEYSVVKKGSGPAPVKGDIVGIRFKGMYNGVVFDDIFGSEEPYFYRAGTDKVLKVSVKHVFLFPCVVLWGMGSLRTRGNEEAVR